MCSLEKNLEETMRLNQKRILLSLIVVLFLPALSYSQSSWDNFLYAGNKIVWSLDSWRFNTELQIRLKDNTQALEYWYIEGVASYMPSKYWEIVPDLRFSIYPDHVEVRPGLGILFKLTWNNKHQFVQQLKWQSDFPVYNADKHGLRYAIFYNYVFNSKYFFVSGAGLFYRISDTFTNLKFIRTYVGGQINFGGSHAISISYMLNLTNYDPNGFAWGYSGGPMIIYTYRFHDDFKYIPARYVNF
jgi:hypothetical protein